MTDEQRTAKSTAGRDPLGKLLARYHGYSKGLLLLGVAAGVAVLGLAVVFNAGRISRALFDNEQLHGVYAGIGWALVLAAAMCAALSPTYLTQAFTVHKKGVRHVCWFRTRELYWDEIAQIDIHKVSVLSAGGGRGRHSSYTITFEADVPIQLKPGFLAVINAFALIQVLKLHGDRPIESDDEIVVPRTAMDTLPVRIRPGKRNWGRGKDSADKDAGARGPFGEAQKKLDAGEPAPVVEGWLRGQGIPAPAAAAMIDKILTSKVPPPEDDDLTLQARQQLVEGKDPEKVKSWLRDQGVAPNIASAVVANLRQELI